MKKIVFLVPSLTMGGMERVLVNYANLFYRRGYEVTVLNFTSDDPIIIQGFDKGIHYFRCYNPVPHIIRAKWKDILKGNFRILPWPKWIRFHSAKYLHRKFIKGTFDVEVAFFGAPSMKIVGGCENSNTRKLGWIHCTGVHDLSLGNLKNAKAAYDSLDKLICVSDLARVEMEEKFQVKNAYTINNPNDSRRIRELGEESDVPTKKKFTFITAARLEDKQKRFIRLLTALKRIKGDGLDFEYWILGDGIDEVLIKEKAQEYQLNNVLFFGKQGNPYKYIRNADMYVCASDSEGFSMVMMEAVILGTPMLSTAVSGASEMLDDGKYGMIVENSEDGLYQGLKKILEDRALYEHYKEMAQLRKNYLSEEEIMNRVEKIINE